MDSPTFEEFRKQRVETDMLRLPAPYPAGKPFYINVNKHLLAYNRKYGTDLPIWRIQRGHDVYYCRSFQTTGLLHSAYTPLEPLECGAVAYLLTYSELLLQSPCQYQIIRMYTDLVMAGKGQEEISDGR